MTHICLLVFMEMCILLYLWYFCVSFCTTIFGLPLFIYTSILLKPSCLPLWLFFHFLFSLSFLLLTVSPSVFLSPSLSFSHLHYSLFLSPSLSFFLSIAPSFFISLCTFFCISFSPQLIRARWHLTGAWICSWFLPRVQFFLATVTSCLL